MINAKSKSGSPHAQQIRDASDLVQAIDKRSQSGQYIAP